VIDIGLQAGRDLASQATEANKALQLGVVGHSRPLDEFSTVLPWAEARFEESGLPCGLLLWRSWGVRKFSMSVAAR
jgi:hypothetical protein